MSIKGDVGRVCNKVTAHKNANQDLQVSIEKDIAVVCKAAMREQGSACKTADRKADG